MRYNLSHNVVIPRIIQPQNVFAMRVNGRSFTETISMSDGQY